MVARSPSITTTVSTQAIPCHSGRNNAILAGMARPYTPAELKVLTAYIASLPGELKTVPQSRFR